MGTIGKALGQRVAGEQVSRARSLAAAAFVGAGAAVVTYRVLRSGEPGDENGSAASSPDSA
ncbi:MAG TPA: hypothetical protein VIZ29_04695 [Gaiellaceae bacterium]|jgi:hypothetical protein